MPCRYQLTGVDLTLLFKQYRTPLRIDEIFKVNESDPASKDEIKYIIDNPLDYLIMESGRDPGIKAVKNKRRLLQGLLTVRPPYPLKDCFLAGLDRLLQWEATQKDIVDAQSIPRISIDMPESRYGPAEHCVLRLGDITTLKADAVVNAANSNLLGCFTPFHACIDNALHSAAGPRLRQDCDVIMKMQGKPEIMGTAKITRGYHLPARFILHTVGPVYSGPGIRSEQADQLASCYQACLDLGSQLSAIKTIAFCSISTGIFGFPLDAAARIALDTVAQWMKEHPHRLNVIFNVFSGTDLAVYKKNILEWHHDE